MKAYSWKKLVGIFVVLGLLFVAFMAKKYGDTVLLRINSYSLFAKFNNKSWLTVGSPVRLLGFEIGRVADLTLINS